MNNILLIVHKAILEYCVLAKFNVKKKRNMSLVKRLISDCEKNILQLEKNKSRIEKKMNDPDFYSGENINIAKKASKRHAELILSIENEEKTWSSLLIEFEDD